MASLPFDRRVIPQGAEVSRWQARDGWPLRCFTWPAAAGVAQRGSILFQGGRGDIFEKYLESFDHWHRQGWSVTSFDWRGQGGSGRLTDAGKCGHIDDFDEFIVDLKDFYRAWRDATPGPHVAMGHSMGGHLLLRAMTEGAIAPDAAVLIAPMLGLHSPLGLGETLAKLLGGAGDRSRPAWKGNEKPYTSASRASLLTHDRERYEDELFWHEADGGALFTGPPSWNWVIQAFRSTRELRTNPNLKTMRVPVLALLAEKDGLVDAKAAAAVVGKLPDARIVRFGNEAAHEVLREVDKVRNRALGEIDMFLQSRVQRA